MGHLGRLTKVAQLRGPHTHVLVVAEDRLEVPRPLRQTVVLERKDVRRVAIGDRPLARLVTVAVREPPDELYFETLRLTSGSPGEELRSRGWLS